MSEQPPTSVRTSHAPRGCNAPLIGLALRPDEHNQVASLATDECRSKASMTRILVLEALEARRAENVHPAPASH